MSRESVPTNECPDPLMGSPDVPFAALLEPLLGMPLGASLMLLAN